MTVAKRLPWFESNSLLRKIQVRAPAPNNTMPKFLLLQLLSATTHKLRKVGVDLGQTLQRRKCLVHHFFPSHPWYDFRSEACKGRSEGESIKLIRSFSEVEDEDFLELWQATC